MTSGLEKSCLFSLLDPLSTMYAPLSHFILMVNVGVDCLTFCLYFYLTVIREYLKFVSCSSLTESSSRTINIESTYTA